MNFNALKTATFVVAFFLFMFSSLTWADLTTTNAADEKYEQFQVFEDADGTLYLKLPAHFVLIHSEISIPLLIIPNNGLFSLTQDNNGQWQSTNLSEAEFNALDLSASNYLIQYSDFDGKGSKELILRADSVLDDSFVIRNISEGNLSFDVYSEARNSIDLSKNSNLNLIDMNGDGLIDLNFGNEYSLLATTYGGFLDLRQQEPAQGSLVGSTAVQFRVAEDGSATYNLPLTLPAGVAGVKPQLALSYSSNSGDGPLGRGWSFSGTSAIVRCAQNYAIDGVIRGVQMDSSDAYCYNGQRLVLHQGTHGETNAKYHKEVDDLSEITISAHNEYGAISFEITTKAGEYHYFGRHENYLDQLAYAGAESKPHTYMLAAIADIKDNEIKFTYQLASNSAIDETLLETVTWGPSSNLNTVTLNYLAHPRAKKGFRNGRIFELSKILSTILVKVNNDIYRHYSLYWDHATEGDVLPVENITRIKSIQECFDSEQSQCYPATKFNWSSLQTGTYTAERCTEPRPYNSCQATEEYEATASFQPFSDEKHAGNPYLKDSPSIYTGDFDGDGNSDIFFINGGNWRINKGGYYIDSDGNRRLHSYSYYYSNLAPGQHEYAKMTDFNGDGRQDLLVPSSGNNKYWSVLYFDGSEVKVESNVASFLAGEEQTTQILDLNGDSFQDLVFERNDVLYYRLNLVGSYSAASQLVSSYQLSNIAANLSVSTPGMQNSAFFDVNGDGISDLLVKGERNIWRCYERGNSPYANEVDLMSPTFSRSEATEFCANYSPKKYNYSYNVEPTSSSPFPFTGVITTKVSSGRVSDSTPYWQCHKQGNHSEAANVIVAEGEDYAVVVQQCEEEKEAGFSTRIIETTTTSMQPVPVFEDLSLLNDLSLVDISTDIRIADMNGDGLSDILSRRTINGTTNWYYSLSYGNGSFSNSTKISSGTLNATDINKYSYHRFIDIDHDGTSDLLAYNGSKFIIYLTSINANGTLSFVNRMTLAIDVADQQLFLADLDGDNKVDLFYGNDSAPNHWSYRLAANAGIPNNLITHYTDGFNNRSVVNYQPLQHNDVTAYIDDSYQQSSSYVDSLTKQRPTTNKDYNNYYQSDYVQIRGGSWVVANASSNAYDANSQSKKVVTVSYLYAGLAAHKLGLGSTGFEYLQTLDHQSQVLTTTQYSQKFPHVGMPLMTNSVYQNSLLLATNRRYLISESYNQLGQMFTDNGGVFPFIAQSTNKSWALASSVSGLDTSQRSLVSHSKQIFNYESDNNTSVSYGNLKSSTSIQYQDEGGTIELHKTTTTNEYQGQGGGEAKGRLSKTQVAVLDDSVDTASVRESQFTYTNEGLLATSTVLGLNQQERFEYDDYGNKRVSCIKDLTSTQQRCTSILFSSNGAYVRAKVVSNEPVAAATNNFANYPNVENYLYNGISAEHILGRISSQTTTGPNGISTSKFYDVQGKMHKEVRADGTETTIERDYVSDNLCYDNLPQACFYEKVTSSGAPDSYTWYDSFGRKIKTQKRAFNGSQWLSQDITFDELNRNITSSNTYTENSANGNKNASLYTHYHYDIFGQVLRETLADNTSNVRAYNGLTTTFTDANGHTREEIRDMRGKLTQVKSNNTTVTNINGTRQSGVHTLIDYDYNVYGKLIKAATYASNDTSNKFIVHTLYDSEGRKTAMYDPDKGHWQYSYNGFGELATQTNANGQVTEIYYDVLGRKERKITPATATIAATTACWTYGTSKANKNVGKLIEVKQFSAIKANCSAAISSSVARWQESYQYDNYGRLAQTDTIIKSQLDTKTFTRSQTYDNIGRMKTQTLPEGLTITNNYQNNYLKSTYQGSTLLREIVSIDSAGRVNEERVGNGITRLRDFNSDNGYLHNITVNKVGGTAIHTLTYGYDNVGNVDSRAHDFGEMHFSEAFVYDELNRMTQRQLLSDAGPLPDSINGNETYQYDFIGNLTYKNNAYDNKPLVYSYAWLDHANTTSSYPLKRKQLSSISKTGSSWRNYQYDNNGNVTNDGDRSFDYTSFDKPHRIVSNDGQTSEFSYGPSNSRYLRLDRTLTNGSLVDSSHHYVGNYERIEKADRIEHKYYLAGAVITKENGKSDSVLFLHNDHQGSVTSITDGSGNVKQQFIYDPWGQKTEIIQTSTVAAMVLGTVTNRAYTGHEGLDHLQLIHMNGRIYDPTIGRFLQADPHVQAPNNSQNYNRYSYVLNNPMSYTDPSGYFFKKLLRSIAKIPILNMAIQAVMAVYCQVCLVAYNAMSTYAVTGSLKAAFTSAIVSVASPGGGSIVVTGVIGGLASKAQGGNFGHGFIAAGASGAAGGIGNVPLRVIASAIIGGTVSKITGGKFANGATSAAFATLITAGFNGELSDTKNRPAHYDRKLTKEEIAQARENFASVKGKVLSDAKSGKLKEMSAMDVSMDDVGDLSMNFVSELTDDNGDYLAGHVSVQDRGAYIDVSNFEISAHGCFTMSECYTTFGHELRHTSSANMQLTPGWFTPSGNKAYDNIVAPRYQENDAEKWGLWYSKQNGY